MRVKQYVFYGEYEEIMMENDWKWMRKNYEYPQGRAIKEKAPGQIKRTNINKKHKNIE